MRYAHTVEQVRAAEGARLAELPEGALMRRAAAGLGYVVLDLLGSAYGRRVLLLVGPGDNGGDALYAGALLAGRGCHVEAWLLADRVHRAGLDAFRAAGGRAEGLETPPRKLGGSSTDEGPEVVVDGIVGIGGRPGLRGAAREALAAVPDVPVVAVDVPSGVDVDTGETPEPHVRATLTVTFGTHKVAHLVDPAATACGAVHLVDLDLDLPPAPVQALQPADVAALLPAPPEHAHKYTRGVVGVRAGSSAYPGAAVLTVAGAGSGLAGMVRYVGPAEETVRSTHPEVVGPGRVQAWVVGPGTGATAAGQLAEAVGDGVPLVIDADALAHLPERLEVPVVLTPHAGELARLLDANRADVEARPLAYAHEAAERTGAVVLLKGRRTLVAHPDGCARANPTGTPWLATAGAGDVLAGLIGALAAGGLTPYDAASVAAWLHGAAASMADGPVRARDVANLLPSAVRTVRQESVVRESQR